MCWSYALIFICLFAALPYGFAVRFSPQHVPTWIAIQLIAVACAAMLVITIASHAQWRMVRLSALGIVTFYYLSLYAAIFYWSIVHNRFDLYLLVDFGVDLMDGIRLIGPRNATLVILGILTLFILLTLIFADMARHWKPWMPFRSLRFGAGLLIVLIGIMQAPAVYGHYVQPMRGRMSAETENVVAMPHGNAYHTESNENVILIQLESTNSLALTGKLSLNGTAYDGWYMPTLSSIAASGTLIPYFFSNQQQTNRAMESILCGIPGNTGKSYYQRIDDLPSDQCLPRMLARNGYKTLFFSSIDDPNFSNINQLVRAMGFSEQHFDDITEATDRKWRWGIDDCDYYRRVFAYLRTLQHNPERFFVYIQLNAAHANFTMKEGYASVTPFLEPQNYLENYFDAQAAQDVCLATFVEELNRYTANAHVMIVGDHPFGLQKGYARFDGSAENFLVPFAYIPPRSRSDAFKSHTVDTRIRFSQSDLIPTIFDLLNLKPYQNSFADVLRSDTTPREDNFEPCQIMHSIYDGATTSIVREEQKYTYVHSEKTIYQSNILADLLEEHRAVVARNVTLDDFLRRYQCRRFETAGGNFP